MKAYGWLALAGISLAGLSGCGGDPIAKCVKLGDAGDRSRPFSEACGKALEKAPDDVKVIRYAAFARFEAKDYAGAMTLAEKAAARGDAQSVRVIGVIYQQGYGVAQDEAKGCELFNQAVKLGGAPKAYQSAGYCAWQARDFATAHALFLKGHEAGDFGATESLGLDYMQGEGVAVDPRKAEQYLKLAAEAGYEQAQGALGTLYLEGGEGVAKDVGQAEKWLLKAIENGNAQAMYIYGDHLMSTHDDRETQLKAKDYLAKAAAAEIGGAKEALDEARVALGEVKLFRYVAAGTPICPTLLGTKVVMGFLRNRPHPLQVATMLDKMGCELTPQRTEFEEKVPFKDLDDGITVVQGRNIPVYLPTASITVEYHERAQVAAGG